MKKIKVGNTTVKYKADKDGNFELRKFGYPKVYYSGFSMVEAAQDYVKTYMKGARA